MLTFKEFLREATFTIMTARSKLESPSGDPTPPEKHMGEYFGRYGVNIFKDPKNPDTPRAKVIFTGDAKYNIAPDVIGSTAERKAKAYAGMFPEHEITVFEDDPNAVEHGRKHSEEHKVPVTVYLRTKEGKRVKHSFGKEHRKNVARNPDGTRKRAVIIDIDHNLGIGSARVALHHRDENDNIIGNKTNKQAFEFLRQKGLDHHLEDEENVERMKNPDKKFSFSDSEFHHVGPHLHGHFDFSEHRDASKMKDFKTFRDAARGLRVMGRIIDKQKSRM